MSSPSATDRNEPATFPDLGLLPALLTALAELGYEEPTPIQAQSIPPLLAGRDVLGQAATGTGKTAAFALPLLQRIGEAEAATGRRPVKALVLVPTRELAMQVAEAIYRYGKVLGVRVIPIYGGQPIERQLRALRSGVDVVVATPGRALDHLRRRTLDLQTVEVVVLDEADEMLDMGFAEDIEALLVATPAGRQTALFSATLPARITAIAERHMREPVRLRVGTEKQGERPRTAAAPPQVRQSAYVVSRAQKVAALVRVLDVERPTSALVFCRTRIDVTELTLALSARGYQAESLHGGLSQEQRDRVMKRFRGNQAELLVATDVAARGLDVEHLSHVINFDVPSAPEAYVHRIGRTGRAGREGTAITLVEPREHRLLRNIEQLTGSRIVLASLPTVADLRARQLELTRAQLREVLVKGELERYRPVVEALSSEFDVVEVALAAVALAHTASGLDREDQEIAAPSLPSERQRPAGKAKAHAKPKAPGPKARTAGAGPGPGPRGSWPVARVHIGAGRDAGLLPKDLVGAIANETGLHSGAIGSITLFDDHSVVELPEEVLEEVLPILQRVRWKGRRVEVRREDEPGERPRARPERPERPAKLSSRAAAPAPGSGLPRRKPRK
jgi:ATP-dependent RNA helicase DeaD